MKRFLYAHPVGMDEVESLYVASMIKDKIYARMADRGIRSIRITVVSGRKDYEKFFPKAGTWEGWQGNIVTRCDATTGKRFYSGYVVTGDTCGKATAAILQHALQERRPVFHYDVDTGQMVRVASIDNDDPEDWTGGWSILRKEARKVGPVQLPLFPSL